MIKNSISHAAGYSLAAETAALVRADAGFYLFIALYTLTGLIFSNALGAREHIAYSIYIIYWLIFFGFVLPLVAFVVDASHIIRRFERKRGLASRRLFSRSRIAPVVSGL